MAPGWFGRQALARQGYLTVGFVINTSNQLIEERRTSLTFIGQKVHYIIHPGSMMNPRTKKSELNLSFLDDETANGTIIIGLVLSEYDAIILHSVVFGYFYPWITNTTLLQKSVANFILFSCVLLHGICNKKYFLPTLFILIVLFSNILDLKLKKVSNHRRNYETAKQNITNSSVLQVTSGL